MVFGGGPESPLSDLLITLWLQEMFQHWAPALTDAHSEIHYCFCFGRGVWVKLETCKNTRISLRSALWRFAVQGAPSSEIYWNTSEWFRMQVVHINRIWPMSPDTKFYRSKNCHDMHWLAGLGNHQLYDLSFKTPSTPLTPSPRTHHFTPQVCLCFPGEPLVGNRKGSASSSSSVGFVKVIPTIKGSKQKSLHVVLISFNKQSEFSKVTVGGPIGKKKLPPNKNSIVEIPKK